MRAGGSRSAARYHAWIARLCGGRARTPRAVAPHAGSRVLAQAQRQCTRRTSSKSVKGRKVFFLTPRPLHKLYKGQASTSDLTVNPSLKHTCCSPISHIQPTTPSFLPRPPKV